MSANKKSKKDVAFEKERAKYRKEIRERDSEIKNLKLTIMEKEDKARKLEAELCQVKEHNNRLLEYMDLSESDYRKIIHNEKDAAALRSKMMGLMGLLGVYQGQEI